MKHRSPFFNLPSSYIDEPYQMKMGVNELPEHLRVKHQLDGLKSIAIRNRSNGGNNQQDRMIFDKRRSFDRALLYSYQSSIIKREQCEDDFDNTIYPNIHETEEHLYCRALINQDKHKMDYDDKVLSVHYEENYHVGDIFEWVGTNTHWIIYLQDLEEKAYFKGKIRKCDYEIEWDGGQKKTYAAVRGPVETKIDYIQKHGISVDNPNYSLNILMPKTKENLEYFRRYRKFYLQDEEEGAEKICWRVEAIDWISTPGILEVNATEYYANETEDDIENGVVGGLIKKVEPNTPAQDIIIVGETFIKPQVVYEYKCKGLPTGSWFVSKKYPVDFTVNPNDPMHIKLMWDSTYSGQFDLYYGNYKKTIVVESLFSGVKE